jgi:hypothetical protein
MATDRKVIGLLSVMLAVIFAGCGGEGGCGGGDDEEAGGGTWIVVNVQPTVSVLPGGLGSTNVTVKNQSDANGYQMTIAVKGEPPTGWTVTGSNGFLDRIKNKTLDLPVEVRVPAGTPTGRRLIELIVTDDAPGSAGRVVRLSVNVGSAANTAIYETAPFVLNTDRRYESGLEVTSGESFPISTLVEYRPLNFVQDADALVWFSPKAGGFVADPGARKTMKCTALPRTDSVAKTYRIENYFLNPWQGGREEKYATQFTVKPPNDVRFTIGALDWLMGVRTTDPDRVAEFEVTFDPVPTGRAGLYTFSVANLDSTQYTATVNPPNAPVNANSDPVTVTVTVNRIGSGLGETVEEFTLRATHDAHADVSAQLRLPIRTYVGR